MKRRRKHRANTAGGQAKVVAKGKNERQMRHGGRSAKGEGKKTTFTD